MFRNEVKSQDNMQGLQLLVAGLGGREFQRIDAVPTLVQASDIYPSLERGTIDAAEFVGPYDDEKLGFHRVAKYYYGPGFWEPCSRGGFIANLRAWEALPAHYRNAVEVACSEIDVEQPARYDAWNPPALRRLVAGGAQLRAWPREVLQAAWREANALYEETAARNPQFRKVWDSYRPWRSEQFQWFRVAENTYDNFAFAAAAH